MFESIRKHMKLMQLLLFILIVPSFVLFGMEGYTSFQERREAVARVDGQEITQAEWDAAHRNEVERLRQQMPGLDARMLDAPEIRYGTLERLVRDRVLAAAVQADHLLVGDQRLARELQRNELVTALRGPDGKLDVARYRQLLSNQGLTPEMFENQVRADLATRQVLTGVGESGLAPPAVARVALDAFLQRREAQVARFDPADYAAQVQPTEAELRAFYEANPQLFQAPEQAAIEYVLLDLETLQKGITVNEADLKGYYEQNAARLAGREERRASHILVTPKDASPEAKQQARARAEELLAQVRQNPGQFAELARQHSQDPGSAAQGGDLDFFARGAMTKPFEDAVFAMQKGQISDVVESDFGFHIIQLTDIKAPPQQTFEEVRPQLEADLRRQQAQARYAEAAETFSNTVYEQPDSLQPVAEKLGLQVRTASNVTRQPQPGATGPLANPRFLEALFSAEATERKRNTEALEVGPNQMVSGRVTEYQPARTKPFEEVQAQVRERVVAQKAAELARKDGQEKLAAWKAAPDSAKLPAPVVLSRQEVGNQPRQVIEAALRADANALPAWQGVDLGPQGYAVVKVNKVLPPAPAEPQQAGQQQAQYARAWTSAEVLAFYEQLKKRFEAEILVAPPQPGATR